MKRVWPDICLEVDKYVPQSCHSSEGAIKISVVMIKAIPMKKLRNIKPLQYYSAHAVELLLEQKQLFINFKQKKRALGERMYALKRNFKLYSVM